MHRTNGDRWFYHPSDKLYAHPDGFGLSFEEILFDSEGTPLHGWFFPAVGGAPKGTVIHCHGNGGNITGHFQFVEWLPAAGWNVLVFDYQGFGRSQGRPTRHGTIADTHAAIDYVCGRDDVDPARLMLFGQSLGGAVGIVVAAQRSDLCGVVVEGAFSEYQREARFVAGKKWWLWGVYPWTNWLVDSGCDPIDSVSNIAPRPIFFITGTDDNICDHRQTLDLHDAAGEPKSLWVIESGRHMSALVDPNGDGRRRLAEFLSTCVGSVGRSSGSVAAPAAAGGGS